MKQRNIGINDILLLTRGIKQKGLPFYSNYCNQCKDIKDAFLVFESKHALAFEWDDMGVKRIYFFASDLDELVHILSCIDKGSVIDFITRDKLALKECFESAGYRLYLEYGRFCVKTGNKEVEKLRKVLENDEKANAIFNAPYGEQAQEKDAEEIDRCLRRVFDPYEAHFYSLDKLREHIRKGWVWVAKENGKIIAGNLFEIQGKRYYGAYGWNDGDIEVSCSMNHKVDKYVSTLGITYSYCWMRLDNKRAIRLNVKYNGSVPDGLYDMIYVKR